MPEERTMPSAGSAARCPQCGGPVAPAPDSSLVTCLHCRATLWVDVDRYLRHAILRPRIGPGEARGAVDRMLRGAEVDAAVKHGTPRLEYHAWYRIESSRGPKLVQASADGVFAEPPENAAASGDTEPADAALLRDAKVAEPVVTLDEAVAAVEGGRTERAVLFHVPVWRIDIEDAGARYTVHVDAVDGEATALSLPPASTRRLDGTAAAWMIACIALFSIEAYVVRGFLWTLVAFGLTGLAVYWAVKTGEREGRS